MGGGKERNIRPVTMGQISFLSARISVDESERSSHVIMYIRTTRHCMGLHNASQLSREYGG